MSDHIGSEVDHLAALLLLADARLPSGAHAHSFGLEAAVGRQLVGNLDDLTQWVDGCLHTAWLSEAAATVLAARLASMQPPAAHDSDDLVSTWQLLDDEVTARMGSSHGRTTSRTLGRQLLRTGRAIWNHPALGLTTAVDERGPTAPLALGAVATAAGVAPQLAALLSLHHAVQSAGTAAIRLLGLDPFAVARLSAGLGPTLTRLADEATDIPSTLDELQETARSLPAAGAPMVELLLTHHQHADGRLFAS